MARRIGGAVGLAALTVIVSASVALAAPQTAQKRKPKRSTVPVENPQPAEDQSYLVLGPPGSSSGGRAPNYVYSSQNQSVFRGTMVGGDSTLFGGNWGLSNPGLR